jgi:hypothetical protein
MPAIYSLRNCNVDEFFFCVVFAIFLFWQPLRDDPVSVSVLYVFECTPQDLIVSVKSIDDFAADASDILLRPAVEVSAARAPTASVGCMTCAIQTVPFAVNLGTPERQIEPTSTVARDFCFVCSSLLPNCV